MPQNIITKSPLAALGYGFIKDTYLPKGKDEYYLRNKQNRNGITYRQLTAYEIEMLVRNGNTSDNWNHLLVSDAFNPELVKNVNFSAWYALVSWSPFVSVSATCKHPLVYTIPPSSVAISAIMW